MDNIGNCIVGEYKQMNTLGDYIRMQTKENGMTLHGLARVAGVNKEHIYNICKGLCRIKATDAIKISKALPGCRPPASILYMQADDELAKADIATVPEKEAK